MKIYIDSAYKCHVLPAEGLREFDVPFFYDKLRKRLKPMASAFLSVPEGILFKIFDFGFFLCLWNCFIYGIWVTGMEEYRAGTAVRITAMGETVIAILTALA